MHGVPGIHVVLVVLKHVPGGAIRDLLHEPQEFVVVDHLVEGRREQVHQVQDLTRLDLPTTHTHGVEDNVDEICFLDHAGALRIEMPEFGFQIEFLPRGLQVSKSAEDGLRLSIR